MCPYVMYIDEYLTLSILVSVASFFIGGWSMDSRLATSFESFDAWI